MRNENLDAQETTGQGLFSEDGERLRFAMRLSGIGIWEVALDSNTVIWDERCRELFGLDSADPVSYEQALQWIHPDDRDKVHAAVQGSLSGAGNGRYDVQYRVIGANDGRVRWVRFTGQAFFDAAGKPVRFGGVAQDITLIIKADQQAAEADQLAQVALDGADAGSFRIRLADDEMEYSPGFARIWTGNEHAVTTRAGFARHLFPEDLAIRDEAYKVAARTGKLNYEARVRWTDGSVHWIQATGAYLNDAAGIPYLFTGTVRDITTEVLRQQQLKAEEARFRDVVEQAPMAIGLLRGPDLMIELGNEQIFRLWGKPSSITGQPLLEAIPELEGQPFPQTLQEVMRTGQPYSGVGELARLQHAGKIEELYFDYTFTPLRDGTGQVSGVMVLASEVTSRVLARKSLEESESRFRSLVENTPDIITRWNPDLRLLFINNTDQNRPEIRAELQNGLTMQEAGYPGSVAIPFEAALNRTFATGEPQEHISTLPVPEGLVTFQSRMVPEKDPDGTVQSVLSITRNITELKRSEDRLRTIITAAPAGICLFIGRDLVMQYPNHTLIEMMGKGPDVAGKPLREIMPELATEDQPFLKILDDVFTTGTAYHTYGSQVKVLKDGIMTAGYYNITYTPLFNEEGIVYGILEIAIDVTGQVTAVQELDRARQTLELALEIGQMGNFTIDVKTETASFSPQIGAWFSLDHRSLPLEEIFSRIDPEDREWVKEAIRGTLQGNSNGKHDLVYRVLSSATGNLQYLHSMGQVQVQDNMPVSITGIIQDVTAQMKSTRELEASERRLRSLMESAPFPIGVYTGREMRILLANQSIIDVWGKGNDVIGKRYSEILPELGNQEIFGQLDQVFTTGIPFHNRNQRVDLIVNNQLKISYFNYSFTPLFDGEGKVYGVMNTAADVTDLALAIQRAEKAEAALLSAMELAALGTWSLDPLSGVFTYSARVREWFGFAFDKTDQFAIYRQIHEKDRLRVQQSLQHAFNPAGNGIYDEEYTIIAYDTGRERILHAQGKAVFGSDNRAVRISGTMQDVTIHRQLQLALENEVQLRTEELASSIEELRVTNEELGNLNNLLTRSNEELAQYAYVASHDLQEPLRKIRMFAGMLSNEKALPQGPGSLVYKIDKSAERMALLIRDLLDFSRLLKSESMARPVNLAEVVNNVVNDFELLIEEKNATVLTGGLPEVEAIALQMNQLFYNLLSNALKFSKPGVSPVIEFSSIPINQEEARHYINKPYPFAQYHHITVKDNGIGFETRFAEHIFEVFKRLHAREIYPGSGIGLAMCRRIADNHNGRLFAESSPGEGSVFHLFLPDKQQEYQSTLPAGFQWTND